MEVRNPTEVSQFPIVVVVHDMGRYVLAVCGVSTESFLVLQKQYSNHKDIFNLFEVLCYLELVLK
jgi:hypothetical protein